MRRGFGILLLGFALGGGVVDAQTSYAGVATCRSFSGQFLIRDLRNGRASDLARRQQTNSAFLRLEPTLLAVSCERIKQDVWEKLGYKDPFRGRIYLTLTATESLDTEFTISSDRFRDGWAYKVDLPDLVNRDRYLQTLVHIVLLELANRGSGPYSAEIPPWLEAGLVRQLHDSKGTEIMLSPPQKEVNGVTLFSTNLVIKKEAPTEFARQELRAQLPLTFDQLSWPREDNEDPGGVYTFSSQLFLNQVLSLNDGQVRLRQMITELPHYLNWQLAFLNAFQDHFEKLVDVEKWWALQLVRFTGREGSQAWPFAESISRLDEVLMPAVQVRAAPNEPALETHITLQDIIQRWEPERQTTVLKEKARELELIRPRVHPDLASCVERYTQTLNGYVAGQQSGEKKSKHKAAELTRDAALKALEGLDIEREVFRSRAGVANTKVDTGKL